MTTPQNDLTLGSDFAPATREMWLKLVEKALKGGDFEKRMVSRSADGLRIEPLTRAPMRSPRLTPRSPGGSVHTRHPRQCRRPRLAASISSSPRPIRAAANKIILDELNGGAAGVVIRTEAPGQSGLPATAKALEQALHGVKLDLVSVQLAGGEDTLSAADALIGCLGQAGHRRPRPPRRVQRRSPRRPRSRSGGLSQSISAAIGLAARYASTHQPLRLPRHHLPGRRTPVSSRRAAPRRRSSPA